MYWTLQTTILSLATNWSYQITTTSFGGRFLASSVLSCYVNFALIGSLAFS